MEIIEKLFYEIGNTGPFLLIIRSLILLRKKDVYFNYFAAGSFINFLLNNFLKMIIKEPRPSVDKKTFELALKHMQNKNYVKAISNDLLGMPSGHVQSVLFTTVYILLVEKHLNWKNLLYYLVICLITIVQRVQYKFHTINQVLVGGVLGIIFGYLLYYLASKKTKGSQKEKEDDGAVLI